MKQIRNFLMILTAMSALLSVAACGGGTTGESTGSAGLGPSNPEDVFDLPNTLPNDFRLSACVPFTGLSGTEHDLSMVLTTTNATSYDFDGDGDIDSYLMTDSAETIGFEIHSIPGTAFPESAIQFPPQSIPNMVGGYEYNTDFVLQDPIPNAFGFDLTPAFLVPPYRRPIFRIGAEAGAYDLFCPGVYVFGAYFIDQNFVEHCAQESFRLVICPVAGICDTPYTGGGACQ